MKQVIIAILTLASFCSARAQMLNVETADGVTYKFPAAQTGDMTYNATGDSVTIMNKRLAVSDITAMKVDDSSMSDDSVSVVYDGASAKIYVAGNIAQYLTPAVSGAHVNIAAAETLAREITYNLSGTSTDGEFYMSGSYKATVELDGLTLKNQNPVTSGAAVHIQNGKRIDIKVISGTENTLEDAATGSQKGCLYVKGHADFKQKGTLNVIGNVKHGIKIGEYMTVNKATINVTSAVGDGISCCQYFLMESGVINISGTGDDGIQCELDGETAVAASDDQHTDEDTGSFYLEGGQITVNCDGTAVKCIKGDGDFNISGDAVLTASTSGNGEWDTEDLETKAASCISVDGNMNINGGAMILTSTGSGGAGMKCDGVLTVNSGDINIKTTGGLYYNNGSTENLNYTGDTDRVSSNYYSSPKGIKAGTKTESGNTTTYSGAIYINGGTITVSTSGSNGEGIESKNTLDINGGEITIMAYDDAINAAQDLTVSGGRVFAYAKNNDGMDSNGNMYIKGGLVYAISKSSPEVALDANTEEQKKLYVSGGTIIAIGGLESGASLTQTCYKASSFTKGAWYGLYNNGNLEVAFQVPSDNSSMGSPMVVSTSGTPTLFTVNNVSGTSIFNGQAYVDASATKSSTTGVSLSTYTSSQSGPSGPGGRW